MSSNQQTVKYVKMFDSPGVLEVKNIETLEGQTVYFLEAEKGMIEPYSERLVEQKFYNYAEVAHYLYEGATEEGREVKDENILRIPVEPVPLPCEECHGENYPNYRYSLVGIEGVLCKPCLNRELATMNAVLSNQQEDRGYDEDFLEARKYEESHLSEEAQKDFLEALNPDNWHRTDVLHTPTMEVKLDDGQLEMTLPDCQFTLGREQTIALARFLADHVKLPPVESADDSE